MAGSPCPVEVLRAVKARMNMRDVTICYGMTETSPCAAAATASCSATGRIRLRAGASVEEEAFPMTVTGKIQQFKMRETSILELGLGQES